VFFVVVRTLKEGMELVWRLEGSRIAVYPKTFKTLHELFKGAIEYGEEEKREIEKELIKRTSEESKP